MKLIEKMIYKKIVKDINEFNNNILIAENWEDINLSYEARLPKTLDRLFGDLGLMTEFYECMDLSYKAQEKIIELQKKHYEKYN